jgi:phosphatidylinositol glycan class T
MLNLHILWKTAIFVNFAIASSFEEYFETLHLKQLKNGQVLGDFEFKTVLDSKREKSFNILPKAIGEIIKEFDIKQLDLHFTVGRWRHDRQLATKQVYPSGALLKTWIGGDFKRLTNSLAGLFCASLNFMTPAVTSSPAMSFFPNEPRLMGNSTLYYSLLPRESVCTENLTPWLKLLPCHSKAGLASLLSPYKIYDGAYQSMGISWASKCLVIVVVI